MPSPNIVVPDDYPIIMATSSAYRRFTETTPVKYYDTLPGSEAALIERIRDFETVINIRSSCKFTAGVFAACPRLKLLSLWGTGTDNVDLAAAAKHGVTVTNTPGVSAPSIAEHSLMLMLAVARRVVANHNGVVAGQWPRGQAALLNGKTLGIVGLDVFDVEPWPAGHPLTKLDNVGLTPHSAGIAPEVLEAGLALAIENVASFRSGKPRNVVQ